ncbi:protein EPIDERMAL PATTERNING FACTOR 2-like [Macadamia integrifolia]|uniref:protein EPIDERMAL PATTERNING FACTOR 2-like n=1 Tax=Macadamia integrifolia TaxID=60698 RepID=UPI001C4E3DD9|nr:protein EPIDERMAL PATTERNING FACTOR 2-like [Macadamia integrifolia]
MMKKLSITSILAYTALLLTSMLLCLAETPVSFKGQGSSPSGTPKDGLLKKEEAGMERFPIGSILPDCAHACGPCFPGKRAMVSFSKCSIAESCHIVYRCRCRGRFYHVPSN